MRISALTAFGSDHWLTFLHFLFSFCFDLRLEGSKSRWRSGWALAIASSQRLVLGLMEELMVFFFFYCFYLGMFVSCLQAGPGTIAEALIRGLPIILNDFIPGQVCADATILNSLE